MKYLKQLKQLIKKVNLHKLTILATLGCFLLTLAVGCTAQTVSRADEKLLDEYISRNYSTVDLEKGDTVNQLGILDNDLDKYEIFLTGEAHSVAANFELQLEFMKYFNQRAGARYLLSEIGYSSGAFVNRYLETGNEENLKIIFNDLEGTAAWNKDGYEFYKKLREYNLTLPEDKRIEVIGIDIEHQVGTALRYILSILPNEPAPSEIEGTVADLKGIKGRSLNFEELKGIASTLKRDIEENEESYRNYLGGEFFDFSIIADNVVNRFNAYEDDKKFNSIREESIYSNFTRVYDYYPKAKYYGQWGMEHVYQRTCNSYMGEQERMAMYINNFDSLKDKVLSIGYGYENCYFTNNQNNYKQAKQKSPFKDQSQVAKYAKTSVTIVKLDGENSPFSKDVYFVEKPLGGVTTDYFQYFVLIKGSNGTTPYEKVE